MKRQPLLVFKTRNGNPVTTRHFSSTLKAEKWLREEGCKFSRRDMLHIGDDDKVELVTEEYEYEIEADIEPARRTKRGEVTI